MRLLQVDLSSHNKPLIILQCKDDNDGGWVGLRGMKWKKDGFIRGEWLAVNGSGGGFGHLLLLSPLKVGGGSMGRWGLLSFFVVVSGF